MSVQVKYLGTKYLISRIPYKMYYQLIQYIKFLLKSTNQHGVHSPFVYNLITKCFYNKSSFEGYKGISEYRKELKKNKSEITITDLGEGSNTFKTKTRSVSKMAKNAGTRLSRAKLLFRITNYFKPKDILELGTSLGIATHAMQLGNHNAHIITIEGCPNLSEFSKENFQENKLNNIQVINNDFSKAINTLTNNTFDLVFFDGNHNKQATLTYFESLLPFIHNDTVFIFDDIYWSKDMTAAWQEIIKDKNVTVTIDTFFLGFVFFRKEQKKEHFIIRL